MKRRTTIKVAKSGVIAIAAIAASVFLASFGWSIHPGSAGRPETTDFRLVGDELDARPYVQAADEFIMQWQKSHGLSQEYWRTPKIVVETETSVRIYFADKEPILLKNGMLVVEKRKPNMIGVEVAKHPMTCQFLPLR